MLASFSTFATGYAGARAATTLVSQTRSVAPAMSSADLEALAKAQNPALGYYDPLNLAQLNFWGTGEEGTVGFLRHAEIKHGRVAMAGFVGYCIQSNGIKFPWAPFDSIPADLSPPAQWDALPEAAKYQIILFIGFLEVYSEHAFILEKEGQKHYMKGGKPGYFPTFDTMVHPVPLNLWDPFKTMGRMTEEEKAKRLNMEVNNGRLAMIGIMGFVSAASVPGSVPALQGVVAEYSGNVMAPFASSVFPMF